MRSVRFKVSNSLLGELLKLPHGAEVIGARTTDRYTTTFHVSSPDLPDTNDPPEVTPIIKHTAESYAWDWNLPTDAASRTENVETHSRGLDQ